MVINELQVLMNNVPVRRLSKNQLGLMSFVYDASWLEHPARRPISLSLPLSPNPYKGEIVRNYFQNLLPDSRNRTILYPTFPACTLLICWPPSVATASVLCSFIRLTNRCPQLRR